MHKVATLTRSAIRPVAGLRPRTGLLLSVALALASCGSAVRLETPSRVSDTDVTVMHPANADKGALLPSPAAPSTTSAPDLAHARGIDASNFQERRLMGRDDSDSYAERPEAQALASELAQNLSLDRDWVWSVLSQARFQPSVPKLMMPPAAPTAKNWAAYRARFIESKRIQAGVQFWRIYANDLERAEAKYGVPAHIIVGVLGVETLYGRNMGRYRVLDTLTTLTLDFPSGRSDRSAYFKSELGAFLLMCREQGLEPTLVTGSFAGAMGWPQFMPSSQRKLAQDFDGDGRIDLTNSPVDAIGSVASYLAAHGWQKSQATYFAVTPPAPSSALDRLLAPDILPTFTPEAMSAQGASLSAAGQKHPGLLALVQLHNGGQAPSYVAGTANFYAITRYNQSSYYALAVAQLGETISKEVQRQKSKASSGN